MTRSRTTLLLCLVVQLFARSAAASVTFPETIRKELELDAVPPPSPGCRVCHKDDAGGLKTVTTPFGRSMMSAGASAANVGSVVGALSTLKAEGTDSDGDGVGDIDELVAGTDPNGGSAPDGTPTAPPEQVPPPETGCTVNGRGHGGTGGAWVVVAALGVLALRRARATNGLLGGRKLRNGDDERRRVGGGSAEFTSAEGGGACRPHQERRA
jgi:hypothetical protein